MLLSLAGIPLTMGFVAKFYVVADAAPARAPAIVVANCDVGVHALLFAEARASEPKCVPRVLGRSGNPAATLPDSRLPPRLP